MWQEPRPARSFRSRLSGAVSSGACEEPERVTSDTNGRDEQHGQRQLPFIPLNEEPLGWGIESVFRVDETRRAEWFQPRGSVPLSNTEVKR